MHSAFAAPLREQETRAANLNGSEALAFNLVQVFSATKARERESLGERITAWLGARPQATIVDKAVMQSSDAEFHCLTIVLFALDGALRST
jgi:hypothetical protein